MEDAIEALKLAGLSTKEGLVYLMLLKEGESQTGRICSKTKIPSSYIYTLLERLLDKGLVSYKVINNIKVFYASEPDNLGLLFEEKEKNIREEKEELLKFIPSLKKTLHTTERLSDFKYFQGIRGIRSAYIEFIDSWKKGDELCFASSPLESFKALDAFFMNVMHKKRVKDKVKFRIIINNDCREWGLTRARLPMSEVRYLEFKTETEFGTVGDYLSLATYGKEPYCLLIKDRTFSDSYKAFFELLWNQAKP